MPGYEKMESLKNGGSWGKFWWKTCGFERVNSLSLSLVICVYQILLGHVVDEFLVLLMFCNCNIVLLQCFVIVTLFCYNVL